MTEMCVVRQTYNRRVAVRGPTGMTKRDAVRFAEAWIEKQRGGKQWTFNVAVFETHPPGVISVYFTKGIGDGRSLFPRKESDPID